MTSQQGSCFLVACAHARTWRTSSKAQDTGRLRMEFGALHEDIRASRAVGGGCYSMAPLLLVRRLCWDSLSKGCSESGRSRHLRSCSLEYSARSIARTHVAHTMACVLASFLVLFVIAIVFEFIPEPVNTERPGVSCSTPTTTSFLRHSSRT